MLATATAVAACFGWVAEAIQVREDVDGAARRAARAAGVSLRGVEGDVIEALRRAAAADDVRALVVGACAEPAAGRSVGHVAMALITDVTKPIVVVGPASRAPVSIDRVLVPLDGSQANGAALRDALGLLGGAGVEAILLHVPFGDAIPPYEDRVGHETESWAMEFLRRHAQAPGARVRLLLGGGTPDEAILRAAEHEAADLIGLGWRQVLGGGRGRVVEHVLANSRVPVVLYPVPTSESTSTSSSVSTT